LIETTIQKEDDIWEAIQLINGENLIYHRGFKEEANTKDVFKFSVEVTPPGQITYQFSCFDLNPVKPVENSNVRLNRAVITFAWYVDPNSDIIREIKKLISEGKG
jgi:hypothetical protein